VGGTIEHRRQDGARFERGDQGRLSPTEPAQRRLMITPRGPSAFITSA